MSSSPLTIIGNVTRDPELKFMESGTEKLEFSVACNHNWRDADGEWQQKTSYIDCVAWRKTAVDIARVLEKGIGVMVIGRLEQRSWDDKDSGQKRSKVEVIVDDVGVLTRSIETLERRKAAADESGPRPAKAAAKPAAKKVPLDEEPF